MIGQVGQKDGYVYSPAFNTTFPATENPINQGGVWVRGASEGVNWTDPRTTGGSPGIAWGTMTAFDGTHYIDSIAHLRGFNANHSARGVVGGSAVFGLEVELLLRFSITSGNARGYEWDLVGSSGNVILVRWNGPGGSAGGGAGVAFDQIQTFSGVTFADGDVFLAEASGPNMSIKRNGTLIGSVDVQAWAVANGGSYWSTGQPGMGFWNETGSSNSGFAWKQFTAANL